MGSIRSEPSRASGAPGAWPLRRPSSTRRLVATAGAPSLSACYNGAMAKKARPRTERREHERAARALVRDKQKLALLSPGGSAERAIDVPSPAVIPIRARATPCPLCGGALRLDDETAEIRDGQQLRAAHVTCVACGVKRALWYRLSSSLPS